MSKPLTAEQLDTLLYLMKDNKAALKLVLDVIYCGQVWDDCIDGDNPDLTPDQVNRSFTKAFQEIPMNEFYTSLHPMYQQQLNALIMSAALQYRDSTQLEMGDDNDRFQAFIIRNAVLSIIHYIILLIGGPEWLEENCLLFWRTFYLRDTYLEFVEEGRSQYAM